MQSQLSEVDERMLVGGGWVNGQQLHQAVPHEADTREGGGGGELAVANKFKVKFLCVCVCVCVCVHKLQAVVESWTSRKTCRVKIVLF